MRDKKPSQVVRRSADLIERTGSESGDVRKEDARPLPQRSSLLERSRNDIKVFPVATGEWGTHPEENHATKGSHTKRGTLLILFAAVALLITAGAALAATRSCDGGRCTGTQKGDTITGSAGEDIILGEGGNDKIFGREGNDGLKGGTGDDEVYGEDGNDKVKGSQGRDKVFGGPGDDVVRGGTHGKTNDGVRDVLDCGPGTDTVYYVRGQDEIKDCEILNPRN